MLRINALKNTVIWAMIWILTALISIFLLSHIVSSPSFIAPYMQSLEDKKLVVMSLAATTAASSTALTLIPNAYSKSNC